jgi:hypothetical protein
MANLASVSIYETYVLEVNIIHVLAISSPLSTSD